MKIPLDCLISFETVPPKASFVRSIKKYGQRDPIKVVQVGDKFLVTDGRRRGRKEGLRPELIIS